MQRPDFPEVVQHEAANLPDDCPVILSTKEVWSSRMKQDIMHDLEVSTL